MALFGLREGREKGKRGQREESDGRRARGIGRELTRHMKRSVLLLLRLSVNGMVDGSNSEGDLEARRRERESEDARLDSRGERNEPC